MTFFYFPSTWLEETLPLTKCRVGLVSPARFRCNECPFSTTGEKAERLTEAVKQIHDKELSRGREKKGSTRRRVEKLEELLQKHSR